VHTKWARKPKGEEQIYEHNRTWFGEPNNPTTPWKFQKTFDDCRNPKTNRHLRYDFGVVSKVYGWVLIEFDGFYHKNPSPWDDGPEDLERRQERDRIKDEYAKTHGYPLLRIETATGLKNALKTFYEENGII
jgi:hypothetical protein